MTMPWIVTLTAALALLFALTAFSPDFDPAGNNCLDLPEEAPLNYFSRVKPICYV